MPARRLVAIGATLAALLSTAACSKPTPLVTVQAGSHAITATPQAWCFTSTADVQSCKHFHPPETLRAGLDDVIHVDVPKSFSGNGWYVKVGNGRSDIKHSLSASFPMRILGLGSGGNAVEIHVLNPGGKNDRGIYLLNVELPKP